MNNPLHVILVPGADALTFEADIAEASRRGIATHALTLPPFRGHPIDARRAHFDAAADIVEAQAVALRKEGPDARIAAIGRNNGGGQLAWAAARGVALDALVFVGAIPEISRFRLESSFESAVSFRNSLSGPDELSRVVPVMRELDIVATAQRIDPARCLIQFGTRDPYIDETSTEAADRLARRFRVEWLDDEHAMESPAALKQRWDFLEGTSAPRIASS